MPSLSGKHTRMTFAMRMRSLKLYKAQRRAASRQRRTSSSISRHCIACATGSLANALRSSIKSAAFCWSMALRCASASIGCAMRCRTSLRSAQMCSPDGWFASWRTWFRDWRRLDERIEAVTGEVDALSKNSDACRRLMTIPGIGPIISSALVAAIGNRTAFTRGRDFAAWLGLVPKQMSTGDRTILGGITKRGNRYLRMLFMQAARVVLLRPGNWMNHGFGPWLTAAAQRLHHNVLATALANKLARIAWSVLVQHREYEARLSGAAI